MSANSVKPAQTQAIIATGLMKTFGEGEAKVIASAPVSDTLAALQVHPGTGLARAEVEIRRTANGYNEVAEKKEHPFYLFLGKFWGLSAWMLELIMILSAALRKFPDLVVVSALLVVNAVVSFMQERRAAGVVETLRRRLQVNARVLREADWQVIPGMSQGLLKLVAASA